MTLLYGFGTMQWYHAQVGSAWYLSHIVALTFLWLALLETVSQGRLLLIGFLIGCAYLARLPIILSIIFPILYLNQSFFDLSEKKIFFKNWLLIIIGTLPLIGFNAWYNLARFGVPYDIGYSLLPVFNEPWYRYGLFNIRYLPIQLKEMFWSFPKFQSMPPFIIPSAFVMAIWVVTPAFLAIPWAKFKQKIVWISLVTAVFVAIPSLIHGGSGFTQFGYRYALDYTPFLLILVASAFQNRIQPLIKLLIICSVLINIWGIGMLTFLHIST